MTWKVWQLAFRWKSRELLPVCYLIAFQDVLFFNVCDQINKWREQRCQMCHLYLATCMQNRCIPLGANALWVWLKLWRNVKNRWPTWLMKKLCCLFHTNHTAEYMYTQKRWQEKMHITYFSEASRSECGCWHHCGDLKRQRELLIVEKWNSER